MNVSLLSTTALQAGLTLADMLLQSEVPVFGDIRHMPSEVRFSHHAKIKDALSLLFFKKYTFIILNNIHVLTFFYFGPRVYVQPSNCCVTAYVALGQKCLETPTLKKDKNPILLSVFY